MKTNHTERGTRWKTINEYIEENTALLLTKHQAQTEYTIIKKDKHVTFNKNKTAAVIYITNICRPQRQGKLF